MNFNDFSGINNLFGQWAAGLSQNGNASSAPGSAENARPADPVQSSSPHTDPGVNGNTQLNQLGNQFAQVLANARASGQQSARVQPDAGAQPFTPTSSSYPPHQSQPSAQSPPTDKNELFEKFQHWLRSTSQSPPGMHQHPAATSQSPPGINQQPAAPTTGLAVLCQGGSALAIQNQRRSAAQLAGNNNSFSKGGKGGQDEIKCPGCGAPHGRPDGRVALTVVSSRTKSSHMFSSSSNVPFVNGV